MSYGHTLANLGIALPIHYAAAMIEPRHGPVGMHPMKAPIGAYMAYRAGREMDENRLTETDALLHSAMLGHSISHIGASQRPYRDWAQKLNEKIFKKPSDIKAQRLYTGLSTLGLALPLYLYFRQGLKSKEQEVDNDNAGRVS